MIVKLDHKKFNDTDSRHVYNKQKLDSVAQKQVSYHNLFVL